MSEQEQSDLHEMRVLLYEDGWDSVGTPQDRLRVVFQRWQETRDANIKLTTREAALRAEIERLTFERDMARDEFAEARNTSYLERAERAEAQLAEARATKDMHKERQEEEIALRLKAQERVKRLEEALVDAAAADLTPEFKEKAKDLHPIDAAQLGYAIAIMLWQKALAAGAEEEVK